MAGSAWQIGRVRDFRGGETQAELPEEVGQNQLIRMEDAMLFPNGYLTAAHQVDTDMIIGARYGIVAIPGADGTYDLVTASSTDKILVKLLDTSATTPVDMFDLANEIDVPDARIVGLNFSVTFLGKVYCVNNNQDPAKWGIINLTDRVVIPIGGSSPPLKLRVYLNRLWLVFTDGTMLISDNGDATTWNLLNVVLLPNSDPIIDFHPVQGGAIVYSASSIYAMYGATYQDITFIPLMLNSPQAPKHFTSGSVECSGVVYVLSSEGVYQVVLNGAQLIPHRQEVFFKQYFTVFSDQTKTITAIYLSRFKAIIFTWPEHYILGGQSLVFYLSGAYSKLNQMLPSDYPYALALNDANTDYLWGKSSGIFAKSTYPSADTIEVRPSVLQTRHEDCGTSRDKVWSCFTIVTDEAVYGVTIQAVLDDSGTPITVVSEAGCSKGENHFWLDELPRSTTISMIITIDNRAIILLVSDDDPDLVLTDDDSGDALTTGTNPGNWTIKEMRLRYREAGPAI